MKLSWLYVHILFSKMLLIFIRNTLTLNKNNLRSTLEFLITWDNLFTPASNFKQVSYNLFHKPESVQIISF